MCCSIRFHRYFESLYYVVDVIVVIQLNGTHMQIHNVIAPLLLLQFSPSGKDNQCTAFYFRPNPLFPLLEPGRADLDPFGWVSLQI